MTFIVVFTKLEDGGKRTLKENAKLVGLNNNTQQEGKTKE